MKKIVLCCLLIAALAACVPACAQRGFAEVKKDNVNMRQSPGGKTLWQLDSPQSVYVFEERTVGDYLWCHIYTYIGKNPKSGWIRGDMLYMLGDEFTDVVDVEAGDSYVVGLRADGTVAILGDDMPHAPCIASVRRWTNIRQLATTVCSVYGLTDSGRVKAVGLQPNVDGVRAAKIGRTFPYPMDKDGRFMAEEWADAWPTGEIFRQMSDNLQAHRYTKIVGTRSYPEYALTTDGEVLCIDSDGSAHLLDNGAVYADVACSLSHAVVLQPDGRVRLIADKCLEAPCAIAQQLDSWRSVMRVEAGYTYALGLTGDGRVLYAGEDDTFARQTAQWTNVVDIAAAPTCCIALFSDGSVAMAGEYSEAYFR